LLELVREVLNKGKCNLLSNREGEGEVLAALFGVERVIVESVGEEMVDESTERQPVTP